MTDDTIVAVFDTQAHASAAVRDLENAGVPASAITQHAKGGMTTEAAAATAARSGSMGGRKAKVGSTATLAKSSSVSGNHSGSASLGRTAAYAVRRMWPQARRYALLAAASSAATLANPYGYQLHWHD
jgi:hypothetical protein